MNRGTGSLSMPRRHDLDALRGGAMLLGIGLHAALSFHSSPWPVQDRSASEWFALFTGVVHGFRMPLFFLLSGFFTMMLYRKRGWRGLIAQRAKRILGPCLAGVLTIVPLVYVVAGWAMSTAGPPPDSVFSPLVRAIRSSDADQVAVELDRGAALDAPDERLGITPLGWSALVGDERVVTLLLERGANLQAANWDGATPLHAAAFRGWDAIVEQLLERGADPRAKSRQGDTPLEASRATAEVTNYIERLVALPPRSAAELDAGRERARNLLEAALRNKSVEQESAGDASRAGVEGPSGETSDGAAASLTNAWSQTRARWLRAYRGWLASDLWRVSIGQRSVHLIETEVFSHLWFLWYLWWLVVLFVAVAPLARRLSGALRGGDRSWWLLSPVRFVWLVPLTCVPLLFMNPFGPDTSPGLVPPPHLLIYYAIFFGVGAWYFDADDREGQVGRRWKTSLAISLFAGFPMLVITMTAPGAHAVVNACYAWGMCFGLMGLARATLSTERPAVRYLSDSSYWLYLAHLPLVMFLQTICRDWPGPAVAKFMGLMAVATLALLASYHVLVRPTWLGRWLNGPASRSATASTPSPAAEANSAS